jgi:hypothetical protein
MREALAMHFHNGRTHGGAFVKDPRSLRLRRARRALTIPKSLVEEVHREIGRRPGTLYGNRDVVGVAMIAGAHTLGYLAGLVTGSGSSPRHIT